ncbi:MAG: roadblock/LC7 domain-containing protein [Myxococcota bacterium]
MTSPTLAELLRVAALSRATVGYVVHGPGIEGRISVEEGTASTAELRLSDGTLLEGSPALERMLMTASSVVEVESLNSDIPSPNIATPGPSGTSSPGSTRERGSRVHPTWSSTHQRVEDKNVNTANPLQKIVNDMRTSTPGSVAAGIFSIADGLMLAVSSSIPDTNVDAMSGSHVGIVDKLMRFTQLIPERIRGELESVVLELEHMSFYMAMDEQRRFAIMLASDHEEGNLGYVRMIAKKQVPKVAEIFDAI